MAWDGMGWDVIGEMMSIIMSMNRREDGMGWHGMGCHRCGTYYDLHRKTGSESESQSHYHTVSDIYQHIKMMNANMCLEIY
jgi:hypothetical protein